MAEQDVIAATPFPRTRASLALDLQTLGIKPGMTLLLHSSMKALGWVSGGPVAVVQALTDVLTPTGTLVMPTHSAGLTDPAQWINPPVPESWWETIRETMPAFDPHLTPTLMMGQIVETFRHLPGVIRSDHPAMSFAAWGKHAKFITSRHALDYGLGEQSPLARIYELSGSVLMAGVKHENNTSFHLAEYRIPIRQEVPCGYPVVENGQRIWKICRDIDLNSDRFNQIGDDFEKAGHVQFGSFGSATARIFAQRKAVDFATQWLIKHPLEA